MAGGGKSKIDQKGKVMKISSLDSCLELHMQIHDCCTHRYSRTGVNGSKGVLRKVRMTIIIIVFIILGREIGSTGRPTF